MSIAMIPAILAFTFCGIFLLSAAILIAARRAQRNSSREK
jgi:hypothetical protein